MTNPAPTPAPTLRTALEEATVRLFERGTVALSGIGDKDLRLAIHEFIYSELERSQHDQRVLELLVAEYRRRR
jgi:hypothetical protein